MTVRENLIAARALIDTPEKWGKGGKGNSGCLCAFEATMPERAITSSLECARALESQIPRNAKLIDGGFRPLVRFNDHLDTTHPDIMALFDRAIAAQVQP